MSIPWYIYIYQSIYLRIPLEIEYTYRTYYIYRDCGYVFFICICFARDRRSPYKINSLCEQTPTLLIRYSGCYWIFWIWVRWLERICVSHSRQIWKTSLRWLWLPHVATCCQFDAIQCHEAPALYLRMTCRIQMRKTMKFLCCIAIFPYSPEFNQCGNRMCKVDDGHGRSWFFSIALKRLAEHLDDPRSLHIFGFCCPLICDGLVFKLKGPR